MKRILSIGILLVLNSCVDRIQEKKMIPQKVEIFMGETLMSIEKYDRENNLIEKINPTFEIYKLPNCESTDSTIKWFYSYKNGLLINVKEVESCKGEIHQQRQTFFTYNAHKQKQTECLLEMTGDTLSIASYEYIDKNRIGIYHDLKQNLISRDTVLLTDKGKISETRNMAGNIEIINIYNYNEEALPVAWRQIYIKNNSDTVRNRLSRYVYNKEGLLQEIRNIKIDENKREIEDQWVSYHYTFYDKKS